MTHPAARALDVSASAAHRVNGKPSADAHCVSMYGLRVRSDIELPGWPLAVGDGRPDVVVQCEPFDGATFEGEQFWTKTLFEEGEVRLEIRGVAKYAACGGNLIRIAPEPDAKSEDIQLFLTGALFGALLHQRGTFPLHASCVALGGVGVAFAAPSGEGKSTLVANMVDRGARFVSDDICVMTPVANGQAFVWPGPPRVKLDDRGLAALNGESASLEPVGGPRGKFHLPIETQHDWSAPIPLKRVYLLRSAEGEPRIERLTGLDAISAIVDDTYFLTYAQRLGLKSQVFRLAASLSQALVVSRLVRPRGLEHMPAVLDLIERDVSDQ